jgi:predicted acylesterase/phospholipase RssA
MAPPNALSLWLIVLGLASLDPQLAGAQTQTPPKRALVVSGGGAKGAYAAGVLSILMRDASLPPRSAPAVTQRCPAPQPGALSFDVLVGTSTGALITPLVHQQRIRELTRFYTTYGTADVLTQRPILEALTSSESLYLVDQLRRILLEDYAASGVWKGITRDTNKLLVVTGVDLQRSDLVLFYTGNRTNRDVAEVGYRWQRMGDEHEFLEAILASSSEPVGMPPVRWNNSLIWDGGVRSVMPVAVALAQKHVEEVWVIGLNPSPDSPMRWHLKPPATGLEVLARTIDVFSNNVAASDMAKMDLLVKAWRDRAAVNSGARDTVLGAGRDDRRNKVQVFVIRPFESLPGSSLENTLQDQRRMYLHGQKDARHFLHWLKEECEELNRPEGDASKALFRVFTAPQ